MLLFYLAPVIRATTILQTLGLGAPAGLRCFFEEDFLGGDYFTGELKQDLDLIIHVFIFCFAFLFVCLFVFWGNSGCHFIAISNTCQKNTRACFL